MTTETGELNEDDYRLERYLLSGQLDREQEREVAEDIPVILRAFAEEMEEEDDDDDEN